MPTAWLNINTFIAVCELRGFMPDIRAFMALHYLYSAQNSTSCWYYFSCRPGRITALEKPSKFHNWRDRFVYVEVKKVEHLEWMRKWNDSPRHHGRGGLTAVDRAGRSLVEYFSIDDNPALAETFGKKRIPKNWLPSVDCFYDDKFLSAIGLAHYYPRGEDSMFCTRLPTKLSFVILPITY